MADKPRIHEAIVAIMREVGAVPKGGENKEQKYKFRKVDDIYNRLSPLFAIHGVFTVPEVIAKEVTSSQTKSGATMHCVRLSVRYRFFASDGSFVEAVVDGEGMDMSDKATTKAMTSAHKVALSQILAIPFEVADPEANSPEWAAAYVGRVSPNDLLTLKRQWFEQHQDELDQLDKAERADKFKDWATTALDRDFDVADHRLWTSMDYTRCLELVLGKGAPMVA